MTNRLKIDFNRNRNNAGQKPGTLSLKCLKKISFSIDLTEQKKHKDRYSDMKAGRVYHQQGHPH